MFAPLRSIQIKTKLAYALAITSLCFAAVSATALIKSENMSSEVNHEYDYQDIYSTLIPDEHAYPDNFPYQIGLLYDTDIDSDQNIFEQDLHITGIRLYEKNTLIQELPTQAHGLYIPEFEDFNFDGFLDIAIPLASSSTNTFPYQYWIYNPQTKHFEEAPSTFQTFSAAEIDEKHKNVYAYNFDNESIESIQIYQWENNELHLKESHPTTAFSITVNDEILNCDNVPYYDSASGYAAYPIRWIESNENEKNLIFHDWDENLNRYTQLGYDDFLQRVNHYCTLQLMEASLSKNSQT